MTTLTLGIPPGATRRLADHYGPGIRAWLSQAAEIVADSASNHGISLDGFYDAGWTSIVAAGRYSCGDPVILKAFPGHERFALERAALTHWAGRGACRLYGFDDANLILLIELVGCQAGGARTPIDHQQMVAAALPQLHEQPAPATGPVPLLHDYYRETVLPRVEKRAVRYGAVVGRRTLDRASEVIAEFGAEPASAPVMLHSDLYAENVVFSQSEHPVFIDPHPKIGCSAFDWAFWCVYYRLDGGLAGRLKLCRSAVPYLVDEVLAWSLTLAVDGALFYAETEDPNLATMQAVLSSPELSDLAE